MKWKNWSLVMKWEYILWNKEENVALPLKFGENILGTIKTCNVFTLKNIKAQLH